MFYFLIILAAIFNRKTGFSFLHCGTQNPGPARPLFLGGGALKTAVIRTRARSRYSCRFQCCAAELSATGDRDFAFAGCSSAPFGVAFASARVRSGRRVARVADRYHITLATKAQARGAPRVHSALTNDGHLLK